MPTNFFEGRRTISANMLKGPRVYSTDLLAGNLSNFEAESAVTNAARALKIKILTKGTVVLNSTHFVDPLGTLLCMRHPDILTGDGILPAFRVGDSALKVPTNLPDYEAFGLTENQIADHIGWLNARITQVMPWEIADVGERLRQRLIAGLSDDKSAIARFLLNAGDGLRWRDKIIGDFGAMEMDRDRYVQEYIEELPPSLRDKVAAFCQTSYHVIGTTVVNCEAGTDLSPMSRFKADSVLLANRDSELKELSEEAIFLHAFMGYALSQIQSLVLPLQVVDVMSFEEVHHLSRALRQQGFQAKYEKVLEAAICSAVAKDARETLEEIDFDALASVAREIAKEFQTYLDEELASYGTREYDLEKGGALEVAADIGLDALSGIPGPGNVISAAKTAINASKFLGMSARAFGLRDNEKAFAAASDRKRNEISTVIRELQVSRNKQAQLLDAVAALTDIYVIRARRA